jgi:hypothetical protein
MNEETLKLIQAHPELLQAFLDEHGFKEYVDAQAPKLEEAKLQAIVDAGKEAEAKLAVLTAEVIK